MPESLCAGWRVDWPRLLQRSSRLPPQPEAGKPHPSISSQPSSSSLLPPGPYTPAVPGRTRLHPPLEPAGRGGAGQHPSSLALGPEPLGEWAGLPSPKLPVLLWFCCAPRPAPRSAPSSLSPLSCPPRLPIPALPLVSGLQPLLLLGFPTTRCQALPLSWCSVPFPPPRPRSFPLERSPVQPPRWRHRFRAIRAFFQFDHPCGGGK